MPVITPAISRRFVQSVKLAPAPAPPAPRARALGDTPPIELKASEAQTLVVGSGLIVAAENVPVQTREDLVNCTLFAQLAASGTVSDRPTCRSGTRPTSGRSRPSGGRRATRSSRSTPSAARTPRRTKRS